MHYLSVGAEAKHSLRTAQEVSLPPHTKRLVKHTLSGHLGALAEPDTSPFDLPVAGGLVGFEIEFDYVLPNQHQEDSPQEPVTNVTHRRGTLQNIHRQIVKKESEAIGIDQKTLMRRDGFLKETDLVTLVAMDTLGGLGKDNNREKHPSRFLLEDNTGGVIWRFGKEFKDDCPDHHDNPGIHELRSTPTDITTASEEYEKMLVTLGKTAAFFGLNARIRSSHMNTSIYSKNQFPHVPLNLFTNPNFWDQGAIGWITAAAADSWVLRPDFIGEDKRVVVDASPHRSSRLRYFYDRLEHRSSSYGIIDPDITLLQIVGGLSLGDERAKPSLHHNQLVNWVKEFDEVREWPDNYLLDYVLENTAFSIDGDVPIQPTRIGGSLRTIYAKELCLGLEGMGFFDASPSGINQVAVKELSTLIEFNPEHSSFSFTTDTRKLEDYLRKHSGAFRSIEQFKAALHRYPAKQAIPEKSVLAQSRPFTIGDGQWDSSTRAFGESDIARHVYGQRLHRRISSHIRRLQPSDIRKKLATIAV